MTELKPVETTLKILQKLRDEDTGTRIELAEYLGISPCWVTKYIRKIEEELKLEIAYSRKRSTYFVRNNKRQYTPLII